MAAATDLADLADLPNPNVIKARGECRPCTVKAPIHDD